MYFVICILSYLKHLCTCFVHVLYYNQYIECMASSLHIAFAVVPEADELWH